jgi:hypothetical protein
MALTKTRSAVDAIFAAGGSATPATVGADFSIADAYEAQLYIWYSPGASTATTVTAEARVEISPNTSGDDAWVPFCSLSFGSIASAADEALTATEPVGETTIAVASTTGLTVNLPIFIRNTTTLGNSEFNEIITVTANTSIVLADGLTTEQTAAASTIYTLAERRTVLLPFGANRVRIVYYPPTGPTSAVWKADCVKVTAV